MLLEKKTTGRLRPPFLVASICSLGVWHLRKLVIRWMWFYEFNILQQYSPFSSLPKGMSLKLIVFSWNCFPIVLLWRIWGGDFHPNWNTCKRLDHLCPGGWTCEHWNYQLLVVPTITKEIICYKPCNTSFQSYIVYSPVGSPSICSFLACGLPAENSNDASNCTSLWFPNSSDLPFPRLLIGYTWKPHQIQKPEAGTKPLWSKMPVHMFVGL